MKISIITPTYNSAKTLARTIESVIAQAYSDLEYIIIDGLSSDNTKDIVLNYQNKINIKFISEKDNGIYDAMNKGVKLATGDIIGILNSDDFYDNSGVLNNVNKTFEDKKNDAVYGDIKYFSEETDKVSRYWKAGGYKESKLNSGWVIPHPALFVRKAVYNKYGLFNTDLRLAADYEFILRLLKIYKINIKYLPETFVRMYRGGASGNSLKQRIKGWQELKMAWEMNGLKLPRLFILRRVISKLGQFWCKA
jgi:glycosyltransferase involved in cell wall biosynthesis